MDHTDITQDVLSCLTNTLSGASLGDGANLAPGAANQELGLHPSPANPATLIAFAAYALPLGVTPRREDGVLTDAAAIHQTAVKHGGFQKTDSRDI